MGAKMFGARVARLEDPALLTGRGNFTDDIHLPDFLEVAFVRSPHPHARIRAIDAAAARAHPGVHAVLTNQDLPSELRHATVPFQVPNPAISQPVPRFGPIAAAVTRSKTGPSSRDLMRCTT